MLEFLIIPCDCRHKLSHLLSAGFVASITETQRRDVRKQAEATSCSLSCFQAQISKGWQEEEETTKLEKPLKP